MKITTTEHFDFEGFLEREGLSRYRFGIITGEDQSSLCRWASEERRITREKFDKMMEKYKQNKNG